MTRSKKLTFIALAMAVVIGITGGVAGCTTSTQPEPSPSTPTPSLADSVLTALAASPDGVVAAGKSASPQGAALAWVGQAGGPKWSNTLTDLDALNVVAVAPDGVTVTAGRRSSGSDYSLIALYDASGTMLWKQSFGTFVTDVAFTPDGNVVAVGSKESSGNNSDAWLLVLNRDGDQITTRTFGGSAKDSFTTVAVTPDGGIVAAGDTGSTDGDLSGTKDAGNMVVRFSSDGTTQWVKTFSYINLASFTSSTLLPNGDVMLAGYVSPLIRHRSSGLLLAIGADGQTTWAKTYANDDSNSFAAVTATADGGLIAVGDVQSVQSTGITTDHGLAVELDAAHGLAWANASGDSPYTGVAVGGDGVIYTASQSGAISSLAPDGTPQEIPGVTASSTPSPTPTVAIPSSTPPPLWYQHVTSSDGSGFAGVAVLTDGTIATAGYTYAPDGDFTGKPAPALSDWVQDRYPKMSGLVALYDPTGVTLWVKSFPGDHDVELLGIAATPDGGIVAVGDTWSKTGDLRLAKGSKIDDGVVVKLDKQGDIVWSKSFPGNESAWFTGVAVAGNGNIYAIGTTHSNGKNRAPGGVAGLITKLTASGQVLWTKTYGQSGVEFSTAAVTPDGGAIVGGYTGSTSGDLQTKHGKESEDALVVKISASGAMAWHKIYGTKGLYSDIESVAVARDGTYIAAASGATDSTQFIVRLSQAGKTLSNHIVLQTNQAGAPSTPMVLGPDGNPLLIAVTSPDGNNFNYKARYVIKLDGNDQITWSATFQPGPDLYFQGIAADPDGNVVLCGNIVTKFQSDALVAKIPVS